MIQNSGNQLFLALYGVSAGLLVSAGIFTVLLAVGMAPRFIGKTHTAKKVFLYENCIAWGAMISTFFTAIPVFAHAGSWVRKSVLERMVVDREVFLRGADIVGEIVLGISGLFMGMFVGCLALAIAEMLNSIPIFARRTSYRHGLGIAVLAVAIGKMLGSLYYFWNGTFYSG